MTSFSPERKTVRMRTAQVAAVTGSTITIGIDGTTIPGVPVYGPMPAVGAGGLVLEQGGGTLVLGDAVSLVAEIDGLKARVDALERSR